MENKPIAARINHGRLIADCPNCKSAEFAEPGKPFYCSTEFPGKNGYNVAAAAGKVYPVVFPANLDEITQILAVRPIENRNWDTWETAADLLRENVEHDLPTQFEKGGK